MNQQQSTDFVRRLLAYHADYQQFQEQVEALVIKQEQLRKERADLYDAIRPELTGQFEAVIWDSCVAVPMRAKHTAITVTRDDECLTVGIMSAIPVSLK